MSNPEALLEAYLDEGEINSIQDIISGTNPGPWDLHWIQPDISFDPNSPPEERCGCGDYVEYYWVREPYLIKRWGQERPFWLRVGCFRGHKGHNLNHQWAEEALRELT